MDNQELTTFLLKARTKTYAGNAGKTQAVLGGSVQFEYVEGDYLYRDIYYIGNRIFSGIEAIYFKGKPIWSMSYFGDFKKMTEKETDKVLRKALIENWKTTRLWSKVEAKYNEFQYICEGRGLIDEMYGTEKVIKNGDTLFFFYYAGGIIG